ncbi:Hsp20/alpha crystallin family protein [Halomontanus rarus]|uniref:Hsp20/alpha crystallin family protein n=1 Tax=Halomontanus rarus TaxID=3034020 RepID=UPI0023E8AF77|nr:Hsp20/alpha crystallin family protein [Halovivax sp. TS33]
MNRLFREMDRTFDQFRASWWDEYHTPHLESARPALEDGDDGYRQGQGHEHEHVHTHTPTLEWSGDTTVSLEDEGDAYVFVMDLPGFEKEDIDLTLEDGVLSVRAHHAVEEGAETARTTRRRRVSRRVTIPEEFVVEDVTASYRNGVLEVHLPIRETERDVGHRIDIE